jgi:hypothetical protein
MRLTLRTMLAYMDDILEPADHQDIGQKIEESEFAANLLHKIRDVTRRMRMGAPKVSGRGMGLDPNTVAEYLDNVLSGERVPDFEKVCLESDVHLAEVAACHQILSLVLGEPAEVDPTLRRRMYEIVARSRETGLSEPDEADEIAAPPRTDAEPAVSPSATASVADAFDGAHGDRATPARERLEVPEYLRSQRRSRFWPIAITALLAACLLVAIGMALWGWNRDNPMLSWLPWDKMAPNVAQNDKPKNGGEPSKNGETTPPAVEPGAVGPDANGKSGPTNPPPGVVAPGVPANADGSGNAVKPASASGPDATTGQPSATLPNPSAPPPGAIVPPQPPPVDATQPRPAGPPPGPGPVIGPVPGNAAVAGAAVDGGVPAPRAVPPGAVVPSPRGGPNSGDIPAAAPSLAPPTATKAGPGTFAPAAERLGRMVSEQELLLRLPAGQGEWQRVSPGLTLGLKDRLLALPTFAPKITLSAGVMIKLLPETLLELEGNDPAGIPIVRLEYGRLVMNTAGKPDVRVKLILGDTAGTLTFFDPEATAAIEVRPILVPGTDPQTGPPKTVVAVYATVGQIDWTGALGAAGAATAVAPAGQPLGAPNGGKLNAPARLLLAGSSNDISGSERDLPRWYTSEPANPLDARASQTLNQALDGKTSVTVGLKELVGHRRVENRSLAARSLALIDEFDPFAALLNDPEQRAVWPIEIESLQAALARGPVAAGKVRAMFEKERGKDGDDLYRLLWGYSKDQLQSGAAPILVDDLDNDSLDFRVLSFYNLQKIVGKTFDYRPEATATNRSQPVRRWRDQLKEGLIVPKGSMASKTQAAAAKPPAAPTATDAARGLEPAAGTPPVPVVPPPATKVPPPPLPGGN